MFLRSNTHQIVILLLKINSFTETFNYSSSNVFFTHCVLNSNDKITSSNNG